MHAVMIRIQPCSKRTSARRIAGRIEERSPGTCLPRGGTYIRLRLFVRPLRLKLIEERLPA
jgi:hypothetical protein